MRVCLGIGVYLGIGYARDPGPPQQTTTREYLCRRYTEDPGTLVPRGVGHSGSWDQRDPGKSTFPAGIHSGLKNLPQGSGRGGEGHVFYRLVEPFRN
jgi:hypothetical protein